MTGVQCSVIGGNMKKLFILTLALILLFTVHYSLFTNTAYAVCPVCTVAVGAGLGISRALGIDDAVTSVWIGGLILSMSFWLIDWIQKRKSKLLSTNYQLLIIVLMYILTLVPLWYGKYIGRLNNTLWGVDKILFGTIAGSIAFMIGKWADQKVREKKGKQLFAYQKVVFPILALIIASGVLHFLVS
ncbi:MAG: hypothetical protein UT24_C0007G0010 [Candidatus Woesebacteria bacterium GW2011_GWB1_39_12]|uniref:Uncharacterized protein n=2 Tax=Candidatus Woeseibacteriota TaxID=1752722 RepID=A0A0G0MD41_9BACT|nr:MAG: hypothetical protein UT23_C0004G0089 [Candidatus Woesebacteria bacterium GW2011_GWA1_39_12]KKR01048.1 MAG: hypothetical protein UT24_C0007G0010 [Candidatus Woesebacteria bacterium GW2011_GWB1_39_12]